MLYKVIYYIQCLRNFPRNFNCLRPYNTSSAAYTVYKYILNIPLEKGYLCYL